MTLIVLFCIFLVLGFRIGILLGIVGTLGILMATDISFLSVVPQKIFNGLNIFPFLAMPFFILAGEIMNATGITNKVIRFADVLVGHFKGGLAHTNMVSSVFFAGISGSATSDSAVFGRTLVPEMVKQGYDRPFACAVTAAGSIIGPTIPPSGLMVVYGSLMGVSISGLFATGILPGLVICLACMAIIAIMAKRKNMPVSSKKASLVQIYQAFKDAGLALIMPVIILGGIVFGVVTPTEAASIAVAYSLVIGFFVYRNMDMALLFELCIKTAKICGVIFLIIAMASVMGWCISYIQLPQALTKSILAVTTDPNMILLLIIGLLLMIGTLMDITAMLIILAPILVPVTATIGIDPMHAGIIFVMALNISLMTPPIGACLFVLSSVTGEKMERITVALWPFLLAELLILLLFAYWSDLALLMPRILGFME